MPAIYARCHHFYPIPHGHQGALCGTKSSSKNVQHVHRFHCSCYTLFLASSSSCLPFGLSTSCHPFACCLSRLPFTLCSSCLPFDQFMIMPSSSTAHPCFAHLDTPPRGCFPAMPHAHDFVQIAVNFLAFLVVICNILSGIVPIVHHIQFFLHVVVVQLSTNLH